MTTSWRFAARAVGPCLLLLCLTGCNSGEKLYDVSGTVTFDGKPVPAGNVFFDPDPTRGGTGTQGIAEIVNGKYTTAVNGRGVRGGAYNVRILGYDGRRGNEAPFGQPLFDEYQEKKDLPAANTEVNFDVPKRKK